jgi:hypothetical protein
MKTNARAAAAIDQRGMSLTSSVMEEAASALCYLLSFLYRRKGLKAAPIVLHVLPFPDSDESRQHRKKSISNEKGQLGGQIEEMFLRPEDLPRRSRWPAPATPA